MNKNLFNKSNTKKGFTLLETLVAVFILTLALSSLLTLVTDSLFFAKYANNEITATYLAQEAVDYIRNDRDTTAFQNGDWNGFLDHYGDTSTSSICYSSSGCSFDVTDWSYTSNIVYCDPGFITPFGNTTCPQFFMDKYLPSSSFYHYRNNLNTVIEVPFKRQILLQLANNDEELRIIVTVEWLNGTSTKSYVLRNSLLKWQ